MSEDPMTTVKFTRADVVKALAIIKADALTPEEVAVRLEIPIPPDVARALAQECGLCFGEGGAYGPCRECHRRAGA